MDKLPFSLYGQICGHLDDLEDVIALESTCKRIRNQVRACFWGQPKKLRLTDGNFVQVFLENGKMYKAKPRLSVMKSVCSKARNLSEFDLASYTELPESFFYGFVRFLRKNRTQITSLCVNYINPEAMYASSESRKDLKAYPSKPVHEQLTRLINRQGSNLTHLFIRINAIDFVSLQRDVSELFVEFACKCSQEIRQVLYPLLSGFNKNLKGFKPRIMHLGIRSQGQCVLPAFDFCTHVTIPQESRGCLEEIHYRIPNAETVAVLNYDAFMPSLMEKLNKVSLFIDDLNVNSAELCDIGNRIQPNRFMVELTSPTATFSLPAMGKVH
ncbi:unnamed protein product [Bursaphelenchus xylophilus]|uniref:(pine wood nematode) hypothetical protein n=1 Tax=Bursaphelenchus xylophilus TaxID=6326 RepID=A0A1I7RL13_BURXY|nr:unnamed protein product [Bursaphelenchus xylophilus]CAG9083600.1 unnamed protein product [Bursaphelenchus xylophilus]